MPIRKELLEIICCPVTKQPVHVLPCEILVKINNHIKNHEIKYSDGSYVQELLEEALITEDQKIIYRIDNNVPLFLMEKCILIEQMLNI